jgi:hypothetical protein
MNEIAGRAVAVRIKFLDNSGFATEVYYVAVNDDVEAIDLVKKRINLTDEKVEIVGMLSKSTIDALGMLTRQVRAFG